MRKLMSAHCLVLFAVLSTGAIFNRQKLDWLNGNYIREKTWQYASVPVCKNVVADN